MHIHLPKPLHGWRELLGEVGVIVLGILIALSAEQLIEAWHWHEKVAGADHAMRDEVSLSLRSSEELDLLASCASAQLDNMMNAVVHKDWKAASRFNHETAGFIARQWSEDAYASALAGQVADHFDARRLQAFSDTYGMIRHIRQAQDGEHIAYSTLSMLDVPGLPATDPVLLMALNAIASLKETREAERDQADTLKDFVKDRLALSVSGTEVMRDAAMKSDYERCQAKAKQTYQPQPLNRASSRSIRTHRLAIARVAGERGA